MTHLYKEVLETCISLHKEREWGRFSPQHLVDMEGVGSPEEIDQVCNAFSFWTSLGYFKFEAEIISEDGETICGGCPEDWSEDAVNIAIAELNNPHSYVSADYIITDLFKVMCNDI